MKIEQIYTGCLAQGAYYIESNGEAVVIDPLREVGPYLDRAKASGAQIKYVLETHFHADFVSGHIDLATKSGATIVYGPTAQTAFEAHIAADGEELVVGDLKIKVLHTPGHTMESTCYLLHDESGKPHALFTGDTLFIGDVGRPDLAQKAASMTQEDLAGLLYDSLNDKIKVLPDEVLVYPAHGAGSACGKNMSKETFDTLGNQKETNYALKAATKEQFVAEVTDGLLPPPAYFPQNVAMNKRGYESLDEVLGRGLTPLTPEQFELVAETEEALILDVRSPQDYSEGHVPGSINIGLDGTFAPWVGAMIPDLKQRLLMVCEPGREEEAITRLSRVGYDHALGYLKGSFNSWKDAGKEVDTVHRITPEEFEQHFNEGGKEVVDVRRESEFSNEHLVGALNRPLDFINDWMPEALNKDGHFYIHCQGGYRSMITASILKSRGIHDFTEVSGGYKKIVETSIPRTDEVSPENLLKV